MEESGGLHAPAALSQKKAVNTYWIGGLVDHGAGLDTVKKISLSPPGNRTP
jgi:hypothetical protein